MRDAQIEAIKTYLFLKIACDGKPLWKLFSEGTFNTMDIDDLPLSTNARVELKSNPAAVALLEYASSKDKYGAGLAPKLEHQMKTNPQSVDSIKVLKKLFYEVSYTDYLFSLPMGAGKTYLMAAFIYLDLYFALNEPDNPAFSHNFIILAPSGLKSSIVPSLKTIRQFNPSWVIPEPTALQLKRLLKFEILDEQKGASRSNLTKNPNAQKINNHQPLEELLGLVAVTNAEKVILDRVGAAVDDSIYSKEEYDKIKLANELRDIIKKLPHLAVFIDEVHHASDSDIKLRQVVTEWASESSFNCTLGFSGTPYLETTDKIEVNDRLSFNASMLSNVVYYYPLYEGLGNFLKIPKVNYEKASPSEIIEHGVKDFLDNYLDTLYFDGTSAKLAIYCGQIDTLENIIYPQVSLIASSYGLNPTEAILRYHRGNKDYPPPPDSELQFLSLDTSISKVRIILLVQIGKEGWDCKSLTGVILPQSGSCPTNMVLQTSCRCLRQVHKGERESAIIWMNDDNSVTLNRQLKQQEHISILEFGSKCIQEPIKIERFSRMGQLHLRPIEYYQLKVSYTVVRRDSGKSIDEALSSENILVKQARRIIRSQDFKGNDMSTVEDPALAMYYSEKASFYDWLYLISKESFNTLPFSMLEEHEAPLRAIFDKIAVKGDGQSYLYRPEYDQAAVRMNVRNAFLPKTDIVTKQDVIPCEAELLKIGCPSSPLFVDDDSLFYPAQNNVTQIKQIDSGAVTISQEERATIESLRSKGIQIPDTIPDCHPESRKTYHYIPYHFDSSFEKDYFSKSVLAIIKDKNLEAYYNGDDTLTEFSIDCYTKSGEQYSYIGKYYPDFLIIRRDKDNKITKAVIVETKGCVFADKFAGRKAFMESTFLKENNEQFGYDKFAFLYLEDTMGQDERDSLTINKIKSFFK